MIIEYESEGGAAVAMFAAYAQLGGELAALLREAQYARERAADAMNESAKLRACIAEMEQRINAIQSGNPPNEDEMALLDRTAALMVEWGICTITGPVNGIWTVKDGENPLIYRGETLVEAVYKFRRERGEW